MTCITQDTIIPCHKHCQSLPAEPESTGVLSSRQLLGVETYQPFEQEKPHLAQHSTLIKSKTKPKQSNKQNALLGIVTVLLLYKMSLLGGHEKAKN